MAQVVTLWCEEVPSLKLGPGTAHSDPENMIQFFGGYALVRRDDPRFDKIMGWVEVTKEPKIEVLGDDEPERVLADAHAEHVCPTCGKAFKNRGGKLGHMRSHAPS